MLKNDTASPRSVGKSPRCLLTPRGFPLTLVALALLCYGCTRPAARQDGARLRLASTAPNLTECIFAIGAGDLLVGRTESCDYPPEDVRRIPVIGGFGTPYLEPLLAARPTHVLETVLADPDIARRLDTLHIPLVHVPCTRLDEIPDALRQLGLLTGHEARSQQLADMILAGISAARAETAATKPRPRVALLFAPDSPITAGRHAFISEMLALAGGDNIGNSSAIDYYHVSLEWLLKENPDMLLCLFETSAKDPVTLFAAQTGWRSLAAVLQHRVYTVPDLNTVCRPGPRVLEGLAQLKQVLSLDSKRRHSTPPDPSRSEPK